MDQAPPPSNARMSDVERVKLIDAAMRSHCAAGFLAGVQHAFCLGGRKDDALTAAVLKNLLHTGEIETAMHMRAERRGGRSGAKLKIDLG